jgi:hypothetical protein
MARPRDPILGEVHHTEYVGLKTSKNTEVYGGILSDRFRGLSD